MFQTDAEMDSIRSPPFHQSTHNTYSWQSKNCFLEEWIYEQGWKIPFPKEFRAWHSQFSFEAWSVYQLPLRCFCNLHLIEFAGQIKKGITGDGVCQWAMRLREVSVGPRHSIMYQGCDLGIGHKTVSVSLNYPEIFLNRPSRDQRD